MSQSQAITAAINTLRFILLPSNAESLLNLRSILARLRNAAAFDWMATANPRPGAADDV